MRWQVVRFFPIVRGNGKTKSLRQKIQGGVPPNDARRSVHCTTQPCLVLSKSEADWRCSWQHRIKRQRQRSHLSKSPREPIKTEMESNNYKTQTLLQSQRDVFKYLCLYLVFVGRRYEIIQFVHSDIPFLIDKSQFTFFYVLQYRRHLEMGCTARRHGD